MQPKVTRAYDDLANPERCIVKMYEKYIQIRPQNEKSTAFYLRPKKYTTPAGWFDDIPVGIHTLQQTVSKLCKSCGFEGYFTNHCYMQQPLHVFMLLVWMNN
ncbi:hypothetical protein FSP39_016021 [Pinctada imbricata]|uniref:ZMYM2-like/QRICH1 C-terminal domain-containing protein n=1 Tax=Pinctada imbricata TaxID=66713 RepID=A0AA88XUX8_PINIB|nr:hypothetical protein FSP39_016021 [Pinctada imbricata]